MKCESFFLGTLLWLWPTIDAEYLLLPVVLFGLNTHRLGVNIVVKSDFKREVNCDDLHIV